MIRRIFYIIILSSLTIISIKAQVVDGSYGYYNDALRFSHTDIGGTARMRGLGGAQMALGGDLSSIYANPAGIGMFGSSVVGFSPSLNFNASNTSYEGSKTFDYKLNFNFNNLGIVFSNVKDDIVPGAWRGGAFAIGVNRINDFQNRFTYAAENQKSSIIDYFWEQAEGRLTYDQIESGSGFVTSAYYSYLINPILDDEFDDTYFVITQGIPQQEETVITRGGQNQWSFAYGGNFADKIFIGANIGVQTTNFHEEKTYQEFFTEDPQDPLNYPNLDLLIEEKLDVNGVGVNSTVGVLAKPTDFIRVGASVTTPTIHWMTERYQAQMFTDYGSLYYPEEDTILTNFTEYIADNNFEYSLVTPTKVNGGIAFFINKYGFISGDIEWVDYRKNFLRGDGASLSADNQSIDNLYRSVINYRLGGEFRYNIIRLRLGYAVQGDPYNNIDDVDRSRSSISAGFGVHTTNYYFDFGIVNQQYKNTYYPYTLEQGDTPMADINFSKTNVVFSLGWYF